jgi:hypothetical protein
MRDYQLGLIDDSTLHNQSYIDSALQGLTFFFTTYFLQKFPLFPMFPVCLDQEQPNSFP